MTSQRFTDALSGADGTQALRLRYDVPPIYPDATVPVAVVRPVTVSVVAVRIPEIDPRLAAELAAADARRAAPAVARAVRAPAAPRAARPPAAPPPSRAQAARAGYYQGPVPNAVAPAAPSQHRTFPALPARPTAPASAADRFKAQLGQFGTGNTRSQAAMPSFPQAGRRSFEPVSVVQAGRRSSVPAAASAASAFQPPPQQRPERRRRGGQGVLVVIILFFIVSGVGAKIIDAVLSLIQR